MVLKKIILIPLSNLLRFPFLSEFDLFEFALNSKRIND